MSYVSILKNIPDFLSQPTGIAVIASLGIHGAIAFLMPLMPIDSKSKKEDTASAKTVGLVELNQAEQSRLPQTGIAPSALPSQASVLPQVPSGKFANQPTAVLPPLPPIPSGSSELSLPPLPQSTNVSIASLPKSQPLNIGSNSNFPAEPSLNGNVRPFNPYVQRVRIGQPQPLATSRIPYNVPPIQPASIAQQQEMINTAAPVYPENMPVLPGGNPVTQTTQSVPRVPNVANQQLVTPVGERPQALDSTIALGTQSLGPLPREESSIQVPGLPSAATQRLIARTTSSTERFIAVKEQYPDLETRPIISETVNAKAGQEGSVEGDLVINREGQVEDIKFRSSSTSALEPAAREYLRQYFQKNPPQANGKPKFYPFSIAFQPNSNVRPEVIQELAPLSQTNSGQTLSESQKTLIQRLRVPKVNPQLSTVPLRSPATQSTKEPQTTVTANPRTVPVNSQKSPSNQSVSVEPVNQQQSSRQQVIIKQPASTSQNNQQVIIKQPASTSQNNQQVLPKKTAPVSEVNQEQSTSRQQLVPKKTAPETDEKQASRPEEASTAEAKQKLLQQLRAIREKRQNSSN